MTPLLIYGLGVSTPRLVIFPSVCRSSHLLLTGQSSAGWVGYLRACLRLALTTWTCLNICHLSQRTECVGTGTEGRESQKEHNLLRGYKFIYVAMCHIWRKSVTGLCALHVWFLLAGLWWNIASPSDSVKSKAVVSGLQNDPLSPEHTRQQHQKQMWGRHELTLDQCDKRVMGDVPYEDQKTSHRQVGAGVEKNAQVFTVCFWTWVHWGWGLMFHVEETRGEITLRCRNRYFLHQHSW